MGNCHTVGPNEALVVSGGCCGSDEKSYTVGGWAWAWWLITDIQKITLEIMTLQPKCEDVETAEGVAITVTGVAQVSFCCHSREYHDTHVGIPLLVNNAPCIQVLHQNHQPPSIHQQHHMHSSWYSRE